MKNWIGQVTTGHGMMTLAGTLLAVMSGQMSWQTAVPLLAVGVVGLLWPENAMLSASTQALTADVVRMEPGIATDVSGVVDAFKAGMAHQAAAAPAPKPTAA